MTTGKTIALTRWTFVGKVMSLLFHVTLNCMDCETPGKACQTTEDSRTVKVLCVLLEAVSKVHSLGWSWHLTLKRCQGRCSGEGNQCRAGSLWTDTGLFSRPGSSLLLTRKQVTHCAVGSMTNRQTRLTCGVFSVRLRWTRDSADRHVLSRRAGGHHASLPAL